MLKVLLVTNQNSVRSMVEPLLDSFAIGFCCQLDRACVTYHLEMHAVNCILIDMTQQREAVLALTTALQPYGLPPIIALTEAEQAWEANSREQLTAAGIWEVWSRSDWEQDLNGRQLARTIRWVVQAHQAEKRAQTAQQQLEQDEQLLKQQSDVIDRQVQRIRQLNQQILEVSELKQQFLSMVSHELRTPMNAILGFSQILLRRSAMALSARQRDMVERIHDNAKRLLHSIEEILAFSKIEAGNLKLQPQCVNVHQLIRAVVQELDSEAAAKQLSIVTQTHLANPLVFVDPTQLQQVLFNLISNAIKFTARGMIHVSVANSESHRADRFVISIRDTGSGIQAKELDHIFEPFRQVDQSTTRSHNGIGLGLAVTAALVERMRGTIQVRSAIGQGSEFRVELPYRSDRETDLQPAALHSLDAPHQPLSADRQVDLQWAERSH